MAVDLTLEVTHEDYTLGVGGNAHTLDVTDADFTLELANSAYTMDIGSAVQVIRIGGDPYEGPYEVVPEVSPQTLPTEGKVMEDDLTVLGVPYYEVSNQFGDTVYIASEVG
jgi:hypothetical protein